MYNRALGLATVIIYPGGGRSQPKVNLWLTAAVVVDNLGVVVDYLGVNVRRRTRMSKSSDLIQGTLDLLILKTVALEPAHGWAIAKRIQQVSRDALQISQGSLYPALHRLEQQGWLKAEPGVTRTGREAKFYALTPAGRKQLARERTIDHHHRRSIRRVVGSGDVAR